MEKPLLLVEAFLLYMGLMEVLSRRSHDIA